MRRYVRVVFSRDGEQLSVEDITATSDREWNRPDGFAWTSDAETVRLLAPSGEVLREIAHRADGSWMGWSPDTVLAPDGSLLAFDTRHSLAGFLSGEVTILSSDGEIVASLPATDGRYHLAFDGQWIVERNSGGLDLQRIADGRHFRFEPPGVGYARPFLSRARELQLFDMEDRRVLRYAWPPDVPVREGER
jgi:hypothetical protein